MEHEKINSGKINLHIFPIESSDIFYYPKKTDNKEEKKNKDRKNVSYIYFIKPLLWKVVIDITCRDVRGNS